MSERGWKILIWTISIVVLAVVAILFYAIDHSPYLGEGVHRLPLFHAILNGSTAVLLLIGLMLIRKKNIRAHKMVQITAFILSSIFLVSYVIYHSNVESTTYGGEGAIKYVYYFILLTHIVLAAVVLPLILFTLLRGLQSKYDKHKKLARWTWPIWFYVAVTGVFVYAMISPYY